MATKISFYVLLSVFIIIAGFLGFTNTIGAETLKIEASNVVTKSEVFPIENIEATTMAYMVRDGTFVLENGELGSMKAMVTGAGTVGKGVSFLGFIVYMFGDGSTIVGTFQQGTTWPDPEKKVLALQKSSGELIMGSGRFKGIKGTQTMTGKLLKPIKGESFPKAFNEFILTYTLSP